jgi:peroxiredoxin
MTIDDTPSPGPLPKSYRLHHIIGAAALAAVSILLIGRYLSAVAGTVKKEKFGACLALEPEPHQTKAPDFHLPDLDGKKQRLSEHRGKVVLLSFWATWCPPCVEELPSMARLQQAMTGQEFRLLTVSVDDSAGDVKKFFDRHEGIIDPVPVLMDPSRTIPKSYGTEKFPESYLIDRKGLVRYRFINKRDWSSPTALACIRSLL